MTICVNSYTFTRYCLRLSLPSPRFAHDFFQHLPPRQLSRRVRRLYFLLQRQLLLAQILQQLVSQLRQRPRASIVILNRRLRARTARRTKRTPPHSSVTRASSSLRVAVESSLARNTNRTSSPSPPARASADRSSRSPRSVSPRSASSFSAPPPRPARSPPSRRRTRARIHRRSASRASR